MFVAGLLLTLSAFAWAPPGDPGFQPDEALSPPGGPEIRIFRSVAAEVVSLRLSAPLSAIPGDGLAADLLRIQAERRMEVLAARIGALVEVRRTPRALVYLVSGPVVDLDFLAWVLREGLREPSQQDLDRARRELAGEWDRMRETPRGVLAMRLHQALSGGTQAADAGTLDRIGLAHLRALRARTHRREDLRLVVAGRVPTELVLAAVSDLGLPGDAATEDPPSLQETGTQRPSPEVIRHWVARAYSLEEGDEGAALVATRWLAEVLRQSQGDYEASVELWEVGSRRAVILSGAAYPRSREAMETRLRTLLEAAAGQAGEAEVRRAAAEIRTDILFQSRTPWGLAELVGQIWDVGRGSEGITALLDELDRVDVAAVRAVLQALSASTPFEEELRP